MDGLNQLQTLTAKLKEVFQTSTYGHSNPDQRQLLLKLIHEIETEVPDFHYIHEKTKGLRRIVDELFTKDRTQKKQMSFTR